jgi:hypothetical protein
MASNATAAKLTRPSTTVNGGNVCNATSKKKNDPPQTVDRMIKRIQLRALMSAKGRLVGWVSPAFVLIDIKLFC